MNKNYLKTLGIYSVIIFIVFSAIAFLVPFRKNAAFFVSWLFGTASIAAAYLFSSRTLKKNPEISSAFSLPVIKVCAVYCASQLIVSIVFFISSTLSKSFPPAAAALVCIIIAAVFAALVIRADSKREQFAETKKEIKEETEELRRFILTIKVRNNQVTDPELKKALATLEDKAKYSDPVSSPRLAKYEKELYDNAAEISHLIADGKIKEATELTEKTTVLLENRNLMCLELKP